MRLLLGVPLALTVLALSLPAAASFPGRNGSLLFEVVPAQLPSQAFGGGPVHLWAVSPTGGAAHDLGVVAGNEVEFVDARYTPSGRRIVFLHEIDSPSESSARYSLDLMNAGGGDRRVLVRRPHLVHFAISPDGRSVAFIALDERSRYSLYVTSIAHPHPRLVYRSWPSAGPLQWSTSGGLLVFYDGPCATGFCRVDPSTRKIETVPLNERIYRQAHQTPAVSPDESRIAFYSPFGPAGARVYGLNGSFRRTIAGAYLCVGPFSPDGTELALADWCGGTTQHISVFDFRTRTVRPLDLPLPVPAGGFDRLLDWQPSVTRR